MCATPTVSGAAVCATTDAFGNYRIYGLTDNGTYNVALTPATIPAGYVPTFTPTMPRTATLAGDNDADFGLQPPGTGVIGDTVWIDANEDGAVDPGETLLSGATVKLYKDGNNDGDFNDPQDSLVASTTTDGNGYYQFTGLNPANYLVYVDEAASPVTSPYDGATTIAAAMSLVSGNNPHQVALAAGQVYNDADFGYNWGGSIGDTVWWDNVIINGVQDAGEAPIPNAIVLLYFDFNGNGILDAINGDYQIGIDMTDANGKYLFENLPPGKYLVDVYEDSITTNGIRDIVPTTLDVVAKDLGPKEPTSAPTSATMRAPRSRATSSGMRTTTACSTAANKTATDLLKNVAVSIDCAGNDGNLGTETTSAKPGHRRQRPLRVHRAGGPLHGEL